VNDVDELLRVVQRKVTVKGSGGVIATVVVTARRGKVWVSIQPPFTWDAIMEPGMVEVLIRTLALAAEDAKKMVSGTRTSRGGSCPPTGGTPLTVSTVAEVRAHSLCLEAIPPIATTQPLRPQEGGVIVAGCACAVPGIPSVRLVPACWAAACH